MTGARQESGRLEIVARAATLLFVDGQTTERTIEAAATLGRALGLEVTLLPRWGELVLDVAGADGTRTTAVPAAPVGVEMGKVATVMAVIDGQPAGAPAAAIRAALEAVERSPPVPLARFAGMAALGAAALAVIFGAQEATGLMLIALSAAGGAALRRWVAGRSRNPLAPPLYAALLAGLLGGLAARLGLADPQGLVALCPCMVLVPGPHLLNAALDLARSRVALGAARLAFAGVIVTVICAGLLAGLAATGSVLASSGPAIPVPLGRDVVAAGVAVAAFGTFFSMPWRALPIPILVGMAAHAARWLLMTAAGAGPGAGAFIACLLVGLVVTPLAQRLRMPFAAVGFASVVSLIPGGFLFRMAGGLVELVARASDSPPDLLRGIAADGATALLVLLSMTFGLVLPKMLLEHLWPGLRAWGRP